MAEYLTRIASYRATTANTWEVVYTVPANKAVVISSITVCNTDNVGIAFSIGVTEGGDPDEGNRLYSGETLAGNTTRSVKDGITLSAGQILYIQDDSTRVDYNVFGSIIDQLAP